MRKSMPKRLVSALLMLCMALALMPSLERPAKAAMLNLTRVALYKDAQTIV